MLNIIVCAKVVLNPEAPVSMFRIDPEAKRAIPPKGMPPVLNPYDENCIEAALRVKEVHPGKITVISNGAKQDTAAIYSRKGGGVPDNRG